MKTNKTSFGHKRILRTTFGSNVATLFVSQGVNFILPLFVIPYLVRILGPSNYGELAFSQALAIYFIIIVDYGFDLSATRKISIISTDHKLLSNYISAVMATKLIISIVGFCVILVLISIVNRFSSNKLLFLCSYISVFGSVLFPVWLLRGLEYIKLLSISIVFGRLTSIILLFIFVRGSEDLIYAAAIQGGTLVFSGAPTVYVFLNRSNIKLGIPKCREIGDVLVDGWQAFLSTAAITIYTNTNIFILGFLEQPAVVGYFAAAYKLILAANGLFSPINQVAYPRIIRLMAQSRARAFVFIARLISVQTTISILFCCFIFIFAKYIVFFVLGSQYEKSILLLKIISLLPFFSGLTYIFGVEILMSLNLKSQFMISIMLTALINILIVYPLILKYGVYGAATTVCIVEAVTPCFLLIFMKRSGVLQDVVIGFRTILTSTRPENV